MVISVQKVRVQLYQPGALTVFASAYKVQLANEEVQAEGKMPREWPQKQLDQLNQLQYWQRQQGGVAENGQWQGLQNRELLLAGCYWQ